MVAHVDSKLNLKRLVPPSFMLVMFFSASEEKLAIMEECLVAFPQILLIGLSVKFNQRYPVWNSIEKYIKFADVLAANESLFIFSASYIRESDWAIIE